MIARTLPCSTAGWRPDRGNSYSYDAVGNMSGRTVGGVYVAIAGQHYQYSGSTGTKHYYANGVRIAERVGGTLYWLLSDHLGSTAVTTNASGANVAELRYYAYGKPRYNVGGQKTDYRYTGQRWQNDLGMYWYSQSLVRPVDGTVHAAGHDCAAARQPAGAEQVQLCWELTDGVLGS